jgi:predicted dinucleotide-binding enzyme
LTAAWHKSDAQAKGKQMSYAIIGFGDVGQALAKAFARRGIEVSVATTRDPESFAPAAAAIGPTIIPKKLAEALKADIVFLAVRFESHPDVAKALPTWKGKTIVDVTNAYGVPPEKLGGEPSSRALVHAFAGARLVKGFNHLVAGVLGQDPAVHGGKSATTPLGSCAIHLATWSRRVGRSRCWRRRPFSSELCAAPAGFACFARVDRLFDPDEGLRLTNQRK